jgi:hypothetical protein
VSHSLITHTFVCCLAYSCFLFIRIPARLLLSEAATNPSAACPGGGDQIVNCDPQSTLGILIIQNITLCAAGDNEIIYDIGFLDQLGVFVPLVMNAMSTEISVVIGGAVGFRLVLHDSVVEQTYSRVSSEIAVVTHDQGRNVSFAMKCRVFASFSLIPSRFRLSMALWCSCCRWLVLERS